MPSRIASMLAPSRVTTIFPSGWTAWTLAFGMPAIDEATRGNFVRPHMDQDASQMQLVTHRIRLALSRLRGRAGNDLRHPDEKAVAADDHHRQHWGHHDGQKEKAPQFLFSSEIGWSVCFHDRLGATHEPGYAANQVCAAGAWLSIARASSKTRRKTS